MTKCMRIMDGAARLALYSKDAFDDRRRAAATLTGAANLMCDMALNGFGKIPKTLCKKNVALDVASPVGSAMYQGKGHSLAYGVLDSRSFTRHSIGFPCLESNFCVFVRLVWVVATRSWTLTSFVLILLGWPCART